MNAECPFWVFTVHEKICKNICNSFGIVHFVIHLALDFECWITLLTISRRIVNYFSFSERCHLNAWIESTNWNRYESGSVTINEQLKCSGDVSISDSWTFPDEQHIPADSFLNLSTWQKGHSSLLNRSNILYLTHTRILNKGTNPIYLLTLSVICFMCVNYEPTQLSLLQSSLLISLKTCLFCLWLTDLRYAHKRICIIL